MDFEISPQEAFVVSRIDGETDLRRLISVSGMGMEQTLQIVELLTQKGIVELPASEEEAAPTLMADEGLPVADEGLPVADTGRPVLAKADEQARRFYDEGMMEKGLRNLTAARINLKLAIQYDPYNHTYQRALRGLEDLGADSDADLQYRMCQAAMGDRDYEKAMHMICDLVDRYPENRHYRNKQVEIEFEYQAITPPDIMDETLPSGTEIGDYRVQKIIAKGGMGQIYLGAHPIIGKRVAIKVIDEQLAGDDRAVSRFLMEARSVNQIGHHTIVDIFSIGKLDDGRVYLIMELLEGLDLADILKVAHRLSPPKLLPIFRQLCDAMEVIHQKGFVHRDIKPPNIFLLRRPPYPYIKLLDFGLAKLWSGPSTKTPSGVTEINSVVGTPAYMSPEQCRSKELDFRSDIYSMGVLLYELVTGEHPFASARKFLELIACHIAEDPPPPSELFDVSAPLEQVITQAMQKNPARRFTSARQMLEALELAIPERVEWRSFLDFKEHQEPAGFPRGPLVFPPEELQVEVSVEGKRKKGPSLTDSQEVTIDFGTRSPLADIPGMMEHKPKPPRRRRPSGTIMGHPVDPVAPGSVAEKNGSEPDA